MIEHWRNQHRLGWRVPIITIISATSLVVLIFSLL